MKLVIVGGVAGGASAAARARRLDESAQIVLFERGEFISFANCGLPYHLGGVIPERSHLLVMTPERFRARAAVDVRTLQEVVAIDRERKRVAVRNLQDGTAYEEPYDALILAPGASPVRPPIPGADDPDVYPFWTMADMDRVIGRIRQGARRAVVVGGGFIGLEVAENLRARGLEVRLVELLPQVLPTLDPEMAGPLADALVRHGVDLLTGRRVAGIHRPSPDEAAGPELHVALDDGRELTADFVVLAVGVRPNVELARAAGLALAPSGGIAVDERLRTSDPSIYAVGDAIAVRDRVLDGPVQIPLAGPANRQGRIAADNALGRPAVYRGALGVSVVKVFDRTAAGAGPTERRLRELGRPYRKIYIHPHDHAAYYPGASPIALKLLFDDDGRILGAQAVGTDGVDKRIDVLAAAMRGGMTVYDLEDLDLAYAPPYGAARDPVHVAGMVAANVLRGETTPVYPDALPPGAFVLDVREPAEVQAGTIPGATAIPLGALRRRLAEIPRDRKIVTLCRVGLRGYLAERILRQAGFDAANLSGGWLTWALFHPDRSVAPAGGRDAASRPAPAAAVPAPIPPPVATFTPPAAPPPGAMRAIDLRALQCPGPVVRLRQALDEMAPGEELRVTAAATFASDLRAWCRAAGHELLEIRPEGAGLAARVRKGARESAAPAAAPAPTAARPDTAALVVFSGDLDKVMAAFIIATGLATLGTKVSLFFTFWGLNALRKEHPPAARKDLLSRMFGWMMPRGARKLALSKMHMAGLGTAMMKHVMAGKNVSSLPDLMARARELGVKFIACDMAMDVMGLTREELIEQVDEVAGVAAFAALARDSGTVLFI